MPVENNVKKERDKIFDEGKKQINISGDIARLVEQDARDQRMYSSQIVDRILREHYKERV